MKKLFFACCLLIFAFFSSFAQNSGIKSTVLLKGRILNFKTFAPIETRFFLVGEDGKKIQVKSANDGTFTIPISSSGNYSIQSDNWICVEPIKINISVGSNYTEREVTFYFLPLESGLSLKKVVGFKEPSANFTLEGKEALNYICELNKLTPKLFFDIIIRIDETHFKDQTQTIVEGKKKKKIKITSRQQAEEFAKELLTSIKEYLASQKLPERKYSINVEYYRGKAPLSSTKKGKGKEKIGNTPQTRVDNLEIKIQTIIKTDLENTK